MRKPSTVGSYLSANWPVTNLTVSADFPTPPDPSITTLYSRFCIFFLCIYLLRSYASNVCLLFFWFFVGFCCLFLEIDNHSTTLNLFRYFDGSLVFFWKRKSIRMDWKAESIWFEINHNMRVVTGAYYLAWIHLNLKRKRIKWRKVWIFSLSRSLKCVNIYDP